MIRLLMECWNCEHTWWVPLDDDEDGWVNVICPNCGEENAT